MIRLFSTSVKNTFPSGLQAGPSTKATLPSILSSPDWSIETAARIQNTNPQIFMRAILVSAACFVKSQFP
jgi:hypothetical protein